MSEKKELTIRDECLMVGGAQVLGKTARFITFNLNEAVKEYEATDSDKDSLLAHIQCALDNVQAARDALQYIEDGLKNMRVGISELFSNYTEDEA